MKSEDKEVKAKVGKFDAGEFTEEQIEKHLDALRKKFDFWNMRCWEVKTYG